MQLTNKHMSLWTSEPNQFAGEDDRFESVFFMTLSLSLSLFILIHIFIRQ
jgi:hypothetical protein